MENNVADIWHKGELSIQTRSGTDKKMAEIGPKFIRQYMPLQHRDFFQSLSMIFVAYNDINGDICGSALFGIAGFIESPSETELIINTQSPLSSFNNNSVNVGDKLGLVGIDFASKRRNRVNAIVQEINQKNIKLRVLQSYGNCPKYIQPKVLKNNAFYDPLTTISTVQFTPFVKELILNADVFFIASAFDDKQNLNNRGADMSHRGGEQGFIDVNEYGQLLVPDYVGNGFFNTLGNLSENPIASLLFFDWQRGDAYQIKANCEILWNEDQETKSSNLTSRTLCFTPTKIQHLANSLLYIKA